MIRAARLSICVLLCAALPARAAAADFSIEAELAPASVYVGQEARLTLRLLRTPDAPRGALVPPDLGGAASLKPLGPAQVSSCMRGNEFYVVVERDFALVPNRAGPLAVPGAEFRPAPKFVDVPGQDDGKTPPAAHGPARALAVRPLPPGAATPWLPARRVTLEEHWSHDPRALAAGEPVTRTLVIRADGLAAARLPRLVLPDSPLLRVRADRPELATTPGLDGSHGRSVQRFVLIPTGDGEITLPALRIDWWNVEADAPRSAGVPGRTLILHAAPIAAAPPESPPLLSERAKLRWIVSLLLVLSVALLVWHLRYQTVRDAINRLGEACRFADPRGARDALIEWWTLARPNEPVPLLSRMGAGWNDAAREQLAALDAALYSGRAWDGNAFWKGVRPWLRAQRSRRPVPSAPLPPLFRLQGRAAGGIPPLQCAPTGAPPRGLWASHTGATGMTAR